MRAKGVPCCSCTLTTQSPCTQTYHHWPHGDPKLPHSLPATFLLFP